ncbi:DUF481 domain-containing protein [Paracoccus sp. (in: a-proteobacteria)]|uniref:DUF481 domain-containing protein n=1 Tax=Paracoccus sp. TaxID=267 RepID=UPI003A8A6D94
MSKIALLSGATAILTALSVPAFAQTEMSTGANVTGVTGIDDRITDIEDDVTDDFDRSRDNERFGPADRRDGLFGNLSLSYVGRNGNVDNQDFSLGGRVSYNSGQWAQTIGMLLEYGENDNGDKDVEDTSVIYDARYYFDDRWYAFALGRFEINGMVDGKRNDASQSDSDFEDEFTDYRRDGFIGVGPGYRILNSDSTTWRVQAGIGWRYTQTGAQHRGYNFDGTPVDDSSDSGFGGVASSRLYHRFNDTIFLTNDTDYLNSSGSDYVVSNQLGVNFQMGDKLATRMSLTTEYQQNRKTKTDNTFGVSLVYGF